MRFAPLTVVDIDAESGAVTAAYRNQVLCLMNTSCLRLAVIDGEYPWHQHPRSDELFLVVEERWRLILPTAHGFDCIVGKASSCQPERSIAPAAFDVRSICASKTSPQTRSFWTNATDCGRIRPAESTR